MTEATAEPTRRAESHLTKPYPQIWRMADSAAVIHLCVHDGGITVDVTPRVGVPPLASLLKLRLSEIRNLVEDRGESGPDPDTMSWRPVKPVDEQEVWAAGVTYLRSRDARIEESEANQDVYNRVYNADRPELFFKATPHRTVGNGEDIVIRSDSKWDVPEPELAVVLNRFLEIVGYCVGNDVSSREIEGENPLYLPQAKIYAGSCALGPCIVPSWHVDVDSGLNIELKIKRDNETVFSGTTNTRSMRKQIHTLVEYLGRENVFPSGVVLLTGTGIVPPAGVTLEHGDVVQISIQDVGILCNRVRRGSGGPAIAAKGQ